MTHATDGALARLARMEDGERKHNAELILRASLMRRGANRQARHLRASASVTAPEYDPGAGQDYEAACAARGSLDALLGTAFALSARLPRIDKRGD